MSSPSEKNPKKKKIKNIVNYSALGMQTVAIIWAGSFLGQWIDDKYNIDGNWFTLLLVLSSVALSMYYAVKRLNELNK